MDVLGAGMLMGSWTKLARMLHFGERILDIAGMQSFALVKKTS